MKINKEKLLIYYCGFILVMLVCSVLVRIGFDPKTWQYWIIPISIGLIHNVFLFQVMGEHNES
jgi:hypothetical protein